jgi:anti-sigma regulatory factor (Ser/Thr protein kinase)
MEQRLELGADLGAPSEARAFVDGITEGMPPDVRFAARLLTSELVTNAVRHAGLGSDDHVTVRVVIAEGLLTISASDAGWGFDTAAEQGTGDDSAGLGLSLLTRLAAASTIQTDADGTTVSFTLPVTGDWPGSGREGAEARRQSAASVA